MRTLTALILSAVAMTLVSAVPTYAQLPPMNMMPEAPTKSPEEKEQDAIRDKAYKESLKKIPDAKTSSDPWGTVRNNDAPKTVAPAKPKTKTGSNMQRSQ